MNVSHVHRAGTVAIGVGAVGAVAALGYAAYRASESDSPVTSLAMVTAASGGLVVGGAATSLLLYSAGRQLGRERLHLALPTLMAGAPFEGMAWATRYTTPVLAIATAAAGASALLGASRR